MARLSSVYFSGVLFSQVTSLTRKVEELKGQLSNSKRLYGRTKAELETMDKRRCALEAQLAEKEKEKELYECRMKDMETFFDRERAAIHKLNEETRKQVRVVHFNIR